MTVEQGKMGDHLQIKTLGGLSIAKGGEAVTGFASRKAEALLVYLACNRRTHPREVLAELLWDDRSQRQAMANLRVVLSSLRKELGGYVQITRTTASIAPDAAVSLDVAELEAAADRLREQDGQLSPQVVEEMDSALASYEGDFLEGFFLPEARGFEAWASTERARLHRLALEALLQLGQWHLEQADYGAAVASATRLLDMDRLSEVGHRQLMEAMARSGQRSQALAQYEECRQILSVELGVEPAPATEALHEAIRSGQMAARPRATERSSGRPAFELPRQLTPFIGREKELADLRALLADEQVRLVTITGPGGIGKTSLALEVARDVAERFQNGAAFVSLAPLSNAEDVVPAAAQAIRFVLQSADAREPKEQLISFLRQKEMLLVLDNFEHLPEATLLLPAIVRVATAVKLLATSRERLNLQMEQVYPLRGLALLPWGTVADAHEDPLVQLFRYYAQRLRPSFTLRSDHLDSLREIIRMVGGMPLAVILAAGWVEALSPGEIAAEISGNLELLETTALDMPERQRSMRAVFEGTWGRLSEGEQRLYAALSIFRGGFTLEAAREVAGASPRDLMQLVGRSLLTRVEGGRFEQHELLRQFAARELAQVPQEERVIRGRHSAFYCHCLEEREADLKGRRTVEAEAEIAEDFENVRAAWKWAADNSQEALLRRAGPGLGLFHASHQLQREGAERFRQAHEKVAQDEDNSLRTRAMLLSWQSYLLSHTVDSAGIHLGEQLARQALAHLDEVEERGQDVRAERALALLGLGASIRAGGNPRQSLRSLKASLALYSELGMSWEMARGHTALMRSYSTLADYDRDHEHTLQAQRLFEIVGDVWRSAYMKLMLGTGIVWSGKLEQAEEGEAAIREALAWIQDKDPSPDSAGRARMNLGEVLLLTGQFGDALSELKGGRTASNKWDRMKAVTYSNWATLHLGSYRQAWEEGPSWLADSQDARLQYYVGFNHLILACAALGLGRPRAARRHLRESVTAFGTIDQRDEIGWARAGLAYVALHEGNAAAARDHLAEALQTASDHHLFWPALHALPATALLIAESGNEERAVEFYALASRYDFVANSRWFEGVAGRRIAAVAETMPAEDVAAARARGKARDLWETVEELLPELQGMEL